MKTKQQQNPKGSSIIRTFSEQTPSNDFVDELFPPNFESLFSSKKEVVNYEAPTIPKFLKDKKNYYYLNLLFHKKMEDIVGLDYLK